MKIEYFGHSCFRLTTKSGFTIAIDPYTDIGYELPKDFAADLLLCTHSHYDHGYTKGVLTKRIISSVGEYTFGDVKITGIPSFHDEKEGAIRGENIVFLIEADGLKVCHMGDFGEKNADRLPQKVYGADLLCIPVGGTYTINAEKANEICRTLQAKRVIPMHYKTADSTIDIESEEKFLSFFPRDEIAYASGETIVEKSGKKIIRMERKGR